MTVAKAAIEPGGRWDALDHIRAIAAFLVFAWHFMHGVDGGPVPYDGAPVVPLMSLFNEGHVGVAVFMVLSGYLFAKILDGKKLLFVPFIWARFLRLAPLLAAVFLIFGLIKISEGANPVWYARFILTGFIRPVWPHGGWSIAVEGHFYLLLPFLLFLRAKGVNYLLTFLLVAIATRAGIYLYQGSIQDLSYWTIIGRVDQFILGIIAFDSRHRIKDKTLIAAITLLAFSLFYYLFDKAGGFVRLDVFPSRNPIWIIMPTIEGLASGILIAWYDQSCRPTGWLSEKIARIGYYSYGIYLLHFFFVFEISRHVHEMFDISNIYVAFPIATFFFVLSVVPAWIAFHAIEKPFARFKIKYTLPEKLS